MGNYEQARASLNSALSDPALPKGYRALAEMVRLNTDSREILSGPTPNRQALTALDQRTVKLIEVHPDYLPFYMFLGNLRMRLTDYSRAIEPLEKMSQFQDGKRWEVYRHLTVAHGNEGNHKKALSFGDKAYEMNKTVTSDEEFMYALALSYAATGNIDAAKDTLSLILNKKPSLSSDRRFQNTVEKAKTLSGGKLK